VKYLLQIAPVGKISFVKNSAMIKKINQTRDMFFIQKKFYVLLLIFLITFIASSSNVFAQTAGNSSASMGEATLGVAKMVEVKEKDVKDGSIITSSVAGSQLSNFSYDAHVIGVVARDAAILLGNQNESLGIPVISTGQVYLLVSTKEGNIKKGDLVTTSTIPGVGAKATGSGYVLGTALEDYTNPDPKKVDKIVVDLDLHYFNSKPAFPGTLTDIFKIALLPTRDGPTSIFKYIVAAIVVLGSFILGFLTFGRTAAKGVEALGRNPAAKSIIYLGIIFNVTIVVTIVLAGLVVAFLILRL
jgi:F0F1-type ATP synthase membrane subunit c/vacuolar-type H+-ATPase subunit K